MTPIDFTELTCTLSAKKPLSFPVKEEDGLLIAEMPELSIYAYAKTREELIESLSVEIDVLWRGFALEEDNRLHPSALQLKKVLLETFTKEQA